MLFNSLSFALFLPIVFSLYWSFCRGSIKKQNILLLIASYFFYSCWDWRFLFLLLFSTLLDYWSGIKIANTLDSATRKFWFILSVSTNLGLLGIFKYFNFFTSSFSEAASYFDYELSTWTLEILLPVGISFYTFHGLSYVIDIYKRRIEPENNFVDYSLFVSFFPLLVAGPIERATHLLPQIKRSREFEYAKAVDGLRQIMWGLFKKIVIADQCGEYANLIFNNYTDYSGSTLILGAVLFSFQIYGDFSGYSDIALGTARLFGFELLRNFAFPYFSRDIAEFWRRWHISLSSWFRDYLYIPLGGSRVSTNLRVRNTFIIFLVSGFWHGANWTFIIWGLLNALFIIPSIITKNNKSNLDIVAQGRIFPSIKELIQMSSTFSLTTFAWIFFRSDSVSGAFKYISIIFSPSILSKPTIKPVGLLFTLFIFVIIEWLGREEQYAIAKTGLTYPKPIKWLFYILITVSTLTFANSGHNNFIYFQF